MIVDDLKNASRYVGLHPDFRRAFDHLAATDLATLSTGRHEIEGDRTFLLIDRQTGRGRAGATLEAHCRRIDIQLSISGHEEIGWRPTSGCTQIATPYDSDKDIMFFGDAVESWIAMPPGRFAIFFPDDAHAPLAGSGPVVKAVLKVAVASKLY